MERFARSTWPGVPSPRSAVALLCVFCICCTLAFRFVPAPFQRSNTLDAASRLLPPSTPAKMRSVSPTRQPSPRLEDSDQFAAKITRRRWWRVRVTPRPCRLPVVHKPESELKVFDLGSALRL